ncbi:MAG: preQ(1) synthase [Dehalococcoidia bacterium]|nr:preQ(1) synthase [Dehalococcoidia bacterium]MDD5494808.1 preQ(1) synthase [Dehalococcoidia bacterium]
MNGVFKKIQSLKLVYKDHPQPELLIPMPNPSPDRYYEIQAVSTEFTALCPVNPAQPDFATITIKYVPDKYIIEFKSLKLYLTSYRTVSIFYEASTNQILNDLVKVLKPRSMQIISDWNIRGGMSTRVTAEYDKKKTLKGGSK